MDAEIECLHKDLLDLKREVAMIKNILVSEGELTSWAKKELALARKGKMSGYTRLSAL